MPRLTQSVPKYRKHKASGQAFVELGGQRHYLGPHGTQVSKDQYDRHVAEWLASGRRPAAHAPAFTVIEICDRYRVFAESYYVKNGRPTCLHRVKQAVRQVRQLYGPTPADAFGPIALKSIRQRLIDRDLSRRYINELVDCIRRMFRWAAAEQLVPVTVPQSLAMVAGLREGKSPARETEPVRPVPEAIVEATLPHLPPVIADMLRLQLRTGMRPGEVCILRPVDVDRSADVWIFRPREHKTQHHHRQRAVPLGPEAQRILGPYLARGPEDYCFKPCESEQQRLGARHVARRTPLAAGNRPGTNRVNKPRRRPGACYDVAAYRRAIHRACDRAFLHPVLGAIPDAELSADQLAEKRRWQKAHRWSPNRIRHSAATTIRRQFGLEEARLILGHSKSDTTEIYAQADLTKAMDVARRVG